MESRKMMRKGFVSQSRRPQGLLRLAFRVRRSDLKALYFALQKEMAYQDKFNGRIIPRRFHSNYMAHTLRDVI